MTVVDDARNDAAHADHAMEAARAYLRAAGFSHVEAGWPSGAVVMRRGFETVAFTTPRPAARPASLPGARTGREGPGSLHARIAVAVLTLVSAHTAGGRAVLVLADDAAHHTEAAELAGALSSAGVQVWWAHPNGSITEDHL